MNINQSISDYSLWLSNQDDCSFDAVMLAAESVAAIHQSLANDELSIVSEWLRDSTDNPIQFWSHYPEDDCIDAQSGAMVYYHAHDVNEWDRKEHGHFHLFLRPEPEAAFTHLAALSMSAYGVPLALFATNVWVTDERILPAREILQMLDNGHWSIHRTRPSWQVLQWLDSFLILVRPFLEQLLLRRDEVIDWTPQAQSSGDILQDRDTHVLSEIPIDWPRILESVQAEARVRFNSERQGTNALR